MSLTVDLVVINQHQLELAKSKARIYTKKEDPDPVRRRVPFGASSVLWPHPNAETVFSHVTHREIEAVLAIDCIPL